MPTNYQKFIPLIILILAVGAFVFWQNRQEVPESVPLPDLDRTVEIKSVLTDAQKEDILAEIEELSGVLKNSPDWPDGWLKIALLRRTIGDYEGAREIFVYLSALNPSDYVALINLGNLHALYLKDFPLAEKYYREAIALEPGYIPTYTDLHELYRFSFSAKSELADDILLEGIKANPDDLNLLFTLAQYYEEIGDLKQAREYYRQTLEKARRLNDQKTVNRLEEILANLK